MRSIVAAVLFAVVSLPASATVTTVARYTLGEADAGATSGAVGANPTTDSAAFLNLPRVGSPTYSSNVSTALASTLSMQFNGVDQAYRSASLVSTVTDNFGVEAWVYPTAATGIRSIAYVGNSGNSGWGIYMSDNNFGFLYGGNVFATTSSGTVRLNQWQHVAVVRARGTTTQYLNGAPALTSATGPNTPVPGAGAGTGVGANSANPAEFFAGNLDEVRFFTFAPGAFTVSDLTLSQPRPIPTTGDRGGVALGLLLLTLAGIALSARRRS